MPTPRGKNRQGRPRARRGACATPRSGPASFLNLPLREPETRHSGARGVGAFSVRESAALGLGRRLDAPTPRPRPSAPAGGPPLALSLAAKPASEASYPDVGLASGSCSGPSSRPRGKEWEWEGPREGPRAPIGKKLVCRAQYSFARERPCGARNGGDAGVRALDGRGDVADFGQVPPGRPPGQQREGHADPRA